MQNLIIESTWKSVLIYLMFLRSNLMLSSYYRSHITKFAEHFHQIFLESTKNVYKINVRKTNVFRRKIRWEDMNWIVVAESRVWYELNLPSEYQVLLCYIYKKREREREKKRKEKKRKEQNSLVFLFLLWWKWRVVDIRVVFCICRVQKNCRYCSLYLSTQTAPGHSSLSKYLYSFMPCVHM